MRVTMTAQVGIGAIHTAIILFLGTAYWIETRTFRAVDMPVSLSPGKIGTGLFELNIHAFYAITIGFPEGSTPDCSEGSLRTRRITSIGSLAVYHQNGESTGPTEDRTIGSFLGGFEGKPGKYSLNVEVRSDSGCLDSRKPRLFIIASGSDFDKWNERHEDLCWISFLSGSLGLFLLIIGMKEGFRRRAGDNISLSLFEIHSNEYFPRCQKFRPVAAFPFFSQIRLLYSQILLLVGISGVLVFHFAWGYDHRSFGLFVGTTVASSSPLKSNSCDQSWVVRVESSEKWYLNSERIVLYDLPGLLRQQIGKRTGCTVFFNAKSDVAYAQAIHAIELIEQASDRVVLLTLGTKGIHTP
jgi:hypothetical protein